MNIVEALDQLGKHHALICIENHALIKMVDGICIVWNPNWHSKLNQKDFVAVFANNTFEVYEDKADIDLNKDEEYYKWRNKYL